MFLTGAEELDTVVALATARAAGPQAVLRVVGPRAIEFAAAALPALAPPLHAADGNSLVRGTVRVADVLLDVTAWVYRAPRSYTGDDAVELHLVSCLPLLDALTERLVEAGARPARPGELTRRAFLAGKLDLTAAEAVQSLATAADQAAARRALRQLRGGLASEVTALRERLLDALVMVEAALDFAHEDLEGDLLAEAGVAGTLTAAIEGLDRILRRESGRLDTGNAARVVLFGPPNAGKSTLLNALSGRDAALTSPTAGTTRDAVGVEAELSASGASVRVQLWDVAGVGAAEGASEGVIDAIGAESEGRAAEALATADLVLCVLDGSHAWSPAAAGAARATAPYLRRVVLQKSDLERALTAPREAELGSSAPPLAVSARTGAGLDELRAAIVDALRSAPPDELAPNPRHRALLRAARASVEVAAAHLAAGGYSELAAIDLRSALDRLAEVTGADSANEEVLDRIFSTFCLGK